MVRGLVPVMLLGYNFFKPGYGVIAAAVIVGIVVFSLGIYSTLTIAETHGREMDFIE
jgi:hypothetical protein